MKFIEETEEMFLYNAYLYYNSILYEIVKATNGIFKQRNNKQ